MSYASGQYRRIYGDASASGVVLAAATGKTGIVTCPDANHTVYVQRIEVAITTSAAQAINFRDTAGTPIVIATVPASATGPQLFDFGDQGVALTAGKNLDANNVAGPAYSYTVTSYIRQTGVTAGQTADRTV